jgi:hypothetical protein
VAITYEQAKLLHGQLERRYERRHQDCRALRRYWQGDYWADTNGREAVASVAQLFRDLKGSSPDLGPDIRLVHNILQEVCVKYQTFLSPVPMVRTFIESPYSDHRRAQATKKERAIYGTWWANKMPIRMAEVAWYLPLMGDCFVGIWPDFERKVPRMLIRSPEIAYPLRSFDGQSLDAVMFRWEADVQAVKRQYPKFQIPSARPPLINKLRMRGNAEGEQKAEIIEYSDNVEYVMWANEQELKRVPHNFGFNLYGQMGFIPVPGEAFNHGAVEQVVNLVEMGNALHSLNFQAAFESVFAPIVLENPTKFGEQLEVGAGGVLTVNEGGRAYRLPPGANLQNIDAFISNNQDKIMEASGMPRSQFGVAPTSSVATGKSIDTLNGAATGSTVEMVQGTGIGPELVAWNEKALYMFQNLWAGDQINLYGLERESIASLRAGQFSFSFKGSEIVGSTRNEVVFNPHMDDHERLVMMLQALGGNLVSKRYAREQFGVADNDAMVEEIFTEKIEDMLLSAIEAELQAAPQNAADLEQQGIQLIDFGNLPAGSPAAPPGAATGPEAAPPGAPASLAGGPGQVVAPPFPLPQGSPLPGGAPPAGPPAAGPPAQGSVVTLHAAQQTLVKAEISGRAWLVGEIVQRGVTSGPVEIAVTDPADRQPLADAANFPVQFHIVAGEPKEQAEEIKTAQPVAA